MSKLNRERLKKGIKRNFSCNKIITSEISAKIPSSTKKYLLISWSVHQLTDCYPLLPRYFTFLSENSLFLQVTKQHRLTLYALRSCLKRCKILVFWWEIGRKYSINFKCYSFLVKIVGGSFLHIFEFSAVLTVLLLSSNKSNTSNKLSWFYS